MRNAGLWKCRHGWIGGCGLANPTRRSSDCLDVAVQAVRLRPGGRELRAHRPDFDLTRSSARAQLRVSAPGDERSDSAGDSSCSGWGGGCDVVGGGCTGSIGGAVATTLAGGGAPLDGPGAAAIGEEGGLVRCTVRPHEVHTLWATNMSKPSAPFAPTELVFAGQVRRPHVKAQSMAPSATLNCTTHLQRMHAAPAYILAYMPHARRAATALSHDFAPHARAAKSIARAPRHSQRAHARRICPCSAACAIRRTTSSHTWNASPPPLGWGAAYCRSVGRPGDARANRDHGANPG